MSSPDLLDRHLSDAFDRAHHAPHWAVPNWPDPIARVHQGAVRARARRLTLAAAAVAAVVAGAVVAVQSLPETSDRLQYGPAAAGGGAGASGQTGARWLLTPAEFSHYQAAHPTASPAPDLVPSPAPPDAELTRLQADVDSALPAGTRTLRTDAADGGDPGHATLWLHLADGTPVAVQRYRLDYPLVMATSTDPAATEAVAPERFSDPQTWADGTVYTVVTGSGWGYGFDEKTQWNGPFVWTVTPDGWFTLWTAPVSVDTLVGWAESADASFAVG